MKKQLQAAYDQQEWYVDDILVMAHYQGYLSQLIARMKYQSVKTVGTLLGEMLYWHLPLPALPEADLVSFVPISYSRRCERGFNQAQIIAQTLAKKINKPCCKLLIKKKKTKHQAQLNQQQRQQNLAKCFALNKKNTSTLKAKKILLIDDVITTGSTVNQCAKILQQTSVSSITAVGVASKI